MGGNTASLAKEGELHCSQAVALPAVAEEVSTLHVVRCVHSTCCHPCCEGDDVVQHRGSGMGYDSVALHASMAQLAAPSVSGEDERGADGLDECPAFYGSASVLGHAAGASDRAALRAPLSEPSVDECLPTAAASSSYPSDPGRAESCWSGRRGDVQNGQRRQVVRVRWVPAIKIGET